MSGGASRPAPGRPRPRAHPALAERRRAIARSRGRRRRSGLLLVLGTAAAALVIYWLATGPLLAVSGVAVSGYDRDDRAELVSALTAAGEEGTIIAPSTGEVRLAAERFPWVESVAVARDWPRGLRVTVTEARPAAVGAFEDQAVLISASGRVLGPKEGAPGLGWLRLAVAPPPAGAQLPEGSRAALTLIAAADPEVGARIRALRTDAYGLLVGRLRGGPDLRLGTGDRMAAKATALGLLLANIGPEDEQAATYIDLTIPERPALGPVN
jgi:cell division septal protein FtsQ